MSTQPPLAYEPRQDHGDPPFWPLLRIGLILWSAAIIARHATWWTFLASSRRGNAFLLAITETALLSFVLVIAFAAGTRGPVRGPLLTIAGLCIGYLLVNAFSLLIETGASVDGDRLAWLLASRVQIWVVPILAILAAWRTRRV